jgi:hypothetical protein
MPARLPHAAAVRIAIALAILPAVGSCGGGGGDGGGTEPVTPTFTIGGTIASLTGSGLVLNLNGSGCPSCQNLQVAPGATSFAFPSPVLDGAQYFVTAQTQPTGPSQTCTVAGGNGTVARANVTSVVVTCATNNFAVGGTISGLSGTGLTLQLNGGAPLSIAAASGGYAFPNVPSGTAYTVTVGSQPTNPAQTCTVANGTGTVGAANVSNVNVSCVTVSFTIGGAIAGLAGDGLILQNNGSNDLAVPAGATSFVFVLGVNLGASYNVTVKSQPASPSQTCTVANGSGTATANVTSVVVNCVINAYTIGGTVTGLTATGLSLLLDGGSPLAVPAGATMFTFPGTVPPGASYAVTVASHPAGQTCAVTGGSGTVGSGNVTGIVVTCATNPANTFTVGGSISGLTASGLVLLLNGANSLAVASGATSFAFPAVPSGTGYAVSVGTQPANMTCIVTNGSGTVGSANVTNVAVACSVNRYSVGGTITGYTGTGLSLLLNGGGRVTLPSGATSFTFQGTYPTGTAYTATVAIQPSNPTQFCSIANATGVVGAGNVTNIQVTCVAAYTLSGTVVTILRANGMVLLLNGAQPVTRGVDQPNFSWTVPTGTPYSVTVGTQPTPPAHTCTVANGNGIMGAANVSNITVACIPDGNIIAGSISGYTGTGLTLRINGDPAWAPQSRGKFAFPGFYGVGDEFSVVLGSQPTGPGQTCTIVRGSGKVPAATPTSPPWVLNIAVSCVDNTTSPLSGTYAIVLNGRRQFLTFWPDGTYTFVTRFDDGSCAGSGNGVEYGAYRWNAATGAFTILSGTVDTNGDCGLWDNTVTPQVGAAGTLTRSGSDLTLAIPDGTFTLSAVASTPSSLVGSWGRPDGIDGGFIVLLPDNTYLQVQVQANNVSGMGIFAGYERGCYTATTSTLTLALGGSCQPDGFPSIDNNGVAGASQESLNVPIPYMVTGPNAVTLGGDTFLVRIVPN